LLTTYGIFARGLPQLHTKGQPLCNTSEESKKKLKTKKQQIVIKPVRGASPNKALPIQTTSSTSQSRETVPLTQTKIGLAKRTHLGS
jgi:uncharacterized membrane protein